MNFDEALSYLLSLGHETLTIKLGLNNTQILLAALGNPEREFPSVQIAGTNGKGSTAVMLDSICRTAGIRIGLFTSPHLISITERISINGQQVSEDEFASLTARVKVTANELVERGHLKALPTFFEHVTAIALLAFSEAKVELAILETGLGGRLDSTTAARAEIVAITPIAMDHEEYLGHTLAEIAAEKAAIIQPGVIAIVAHQQKEALEVIHDQCESVGVKPAVIEGGAVESSRPPLTSERASRYRDESRSCTASADGRFCGTFEIRPGQYESIQLGLRGRHQATNAATAIALAEALRELGFSISRAAIVRGIENARHPGRLELWEGQPRILFDGAHNPAAAMALRDYLNEFVNQPITMIFGAMRDKALDEMASILFPAVGKLILTEIDNPRAASLDMLNLAVPDRFAPANIYPAPSADEALRIAKEITAPSDLICVTGSLYLVGQIQKILNQRSSNFARQLSCN